LKRKPDAETVVEDDDVSSVEASSVVPVSKGKGKLKPVDDADLSDGYSPPMLMSSRSVHIIH
jgi:hypothetical protein